MEKNSSVYGNPLCLAKAVTEGSCWRFSVLTESMIRMEYKEDGNFENRASQTVMNRQFPLPGIKVSRTKDKLLIDTGRLSLEYTYGRFASDTLKITVSFPEDGLQQVWHFGESVESLKGTARTLDNADGAIPLEESVISRKGYAVLDDSHTMVLDKNGWLTLREGDGLDLYFFGYGYCYQECIQDFYRLCGMTPLLPKWALGNWWSRYHRYTDEEYRKLISRFKKEEIPFSVAVIDMDWHLVNIEEKFGSGWTGYTWNRELFPDPPDFLAWLHSQNLKTALNVHPADGVRAYEDLYPDMAKALGIDPESGEVIPFDAADPTFMEAYFDVLHHQLEEDGVDFWWIDWQQGTETKVEGLDPLWVLNHYHYLDSTRESGAGLIFSRYAGPGSHRYPVGFSGDTIISWESLRFQPYFTAAASNIGYSWWSHDIGGHMLGYRDDELAVRWVQLGVFSPINRLHSTNHIFSGKEPWNYSREAEWVMKKYLRMRYELIPYLNTMNQRTHREGIPLIRPLYWLEPANDQAYKYPNEYYFGSELLIVPVTNPVNPVVKLASVRAWLPAGLWFDVQTGRVYQGGREMVFYRALEQMPVLAKAGAILVRNCECVEKAQNLEENPQELTVDVFPGKDGCFTLWENGGDRDEAGAFTRLEYKAGTTFFIDSPKDKTNCIPLERSWIVNFRNIEAGEAEVFADGKVIESQSEYQEAKKTLCVKIPMTGIGMGIEIRLKTSGKIVSADRAGEAYEIINRAQIAYVEKERLQKLVEKGKLIAVEIALNGEAEEILINALNEIP